jgi:hypothetical protein
VKPQPDSWQLSSAYGKARAYPIMLARDPHVAPQLLLPGWRLAKIAQLRAQGERGQYARHIYSA